MGERFVDLTDDQYDALQDHIRARETIGHVIASAIIEIGTQFSKQEASFWQQVREIAGAEHNEHCSIEWVTRRIRMKEGTSRD